MAEQGRYLWLEALGRGTVAAPIAGADTDDLGVDATRDAPVLLDVEFGEGVLLVDRGLGNVPDGGLLNHVADQESLDGLVLGHEARAVDTAHGFNVTAALLVSSVVSSLGRLITCPVGVCLGLAYISNCNNIPQISPMCILLSTIPVHPAEISQRSTP